MNLSRKHIIYKVSVIILSITLLAPSFVKFSHVFENHVHQVCKNPQKVHFHEYNLDCDFYNFKLNTQFSFVSNNFQLLKTEDNHQPIILKYHFLSSNQYLDFLRRGPPQLI
ncbi:MAG: hypothetical protein IMY67_05520 [Bacteroidetes bacterium]|nr:hypothetical protein [Bacteroidota bacterium]